MITETLFENLEDTVNDSSSWYYWESWSGDVVRSPRFPGDDGLRGRCSSIPECCITFYVTTWQSMSFKERKDWVASSPIVRDYIPCRECLKRKTIAYTKACKEGTCICGQWSTRQAVNLETGAFESTASDSGDT